MKLFRLVACAAVIGGFVVAAPALAQEPEAPQPPTDVPAAPTPNAPDPGAQAPEAPAKPAKPAKKPVAKRLPKLPNAPNTQSAWIATLHSSVTVRVAPKLKAKKRIVLQPTAPFAGGQTQLLVTRSMYDKDDQAWLEVLLPIRPNGSRGWIPADSVTVAKTPFRVEISIRQRRLNIFRGKKKVMTAPVAVGKAGTPTPLGRFAIAEAVNTNDSSSFYGPLVMPITGYSKVLNEFAGGDGRVAIHGTSVPSLIGTRASHGCVRMRNADIVRVARMAKPGTPVTIKA